MNRREYLRRSIAGVGVSAFVGLTPLNPLRPSPKRPESSPPTVTETPTTPTQTPVPKYHHWQAEFYGDLYGLVTSSDRHALYVSIGNSVSRFDTNSGELTWEAESEQSIEGPVGVGDERVFAAGRQGRVLSLDRTTGERLWFENTDSFSPASPIVYDGTVIVPGQATHAFDVKTGEVRWSVSKRFTSPIALQNDQHLYLGDGRNSAKIDINDGSVIWSLGDRRRAEGPYYNLTIGPQHSLFMGTNGSTLYANSTENGDLEWTASEEGTFNSLCLFQDYLVYISETNSENSKIAAIELSEMEKSWENIASLDYSGWNFGNVSTELLSYNDRILAGTADGHLFTIDPISGEFKAAIDIMDEGSRGMHLNGNRVYLTGDSIIQAIDLSETTLEG